MDRTYEGRHAGQQRYAVIEFCSSPQTLWKKMESGHWDWLGVVESKGSRRFVLGRPPTTKGMTIRAIGTVTYPGEPEYDDTFRVTVQTPADDRIPAKRFGTAEGARAAFHARIKELQAPTGDSGLFRVRLYVDGKLDAEELVVRALPNVL
jgi:hypothetical protein